MDLTKILISPVVTEKSTNAQSLRKYTFMVHQDVNKVQIQKAIEKFYGVKVEKINVIPIRRKARLAGRGREITKRRDGRRVIITLKAKQSIDFNKIKL